MKQACNLIELKLWVCVCVCMYGFTLVSREDYIDTQTLCKRNKDTDHVSEEVLKM
jgi:hypothetical protein